MKLIIFFTIFLFTSLCANTSNFSLIVKQPFDAALFDITEDYDRTITAVGFSKSYDKNSNIGITYSDAFDYLSSLSNEFGTQMHIIKVNNQGEQIFSKQIKLPNFSEAVALEKTPQNGYFVGGYSVDGSLIVLKLDANANIIFNKTFGTKNYDKMSAIVALRDGGVLTVGTSVTSRAKYDALFESGLGKNDIYITRFSKSGAKLWSKKYGTTEDDEGIDAAEAQDGSIIVLGKSSYENKSDVTLMRIDENGDKIWLELYKQETLTQPKKIIPLRDSNFVISLAEYDDMHKEHIRLMKIDLYKNILINKEIFTTYPSALNDIKEFSDGTFIALGYVRDMSNTDALAMILDNNLVMLNQEHYGSENYDLFNAATILHNSQVAVAGIHTDETSQESNMWITKLNRDASMTQISTISSPKPSTIIVPTVDKDEFYNKLLLLFKDEIASKELEINKNLTLELINPKLYFLVGEYKLTKEQELFLTKFSQKLLPFLYENRDIINNLEINGHTSSEWRDTDFSKKYLNNSKLSMNRAYSTLSHIFLTQDRTKQEWLSSIIKGSGLSYAKKVVVDGIENRELSRRVSFRIILK